MLMAKGYGGFPVINCYETNQLKLSIVEHQPLYHALRFCESGIWTENSRDGSPLLYHVEGFIWGKGMMGKGQVT